MQNKLMLELHPTREEIQLRAYELWEKAGRQPNRDLEYWLQAETELRNRNGSPAHQRANAHARHRRSKLKPFGVEGTRRPIL